jgi:two-component system, sensor histidine kinase PdtaS
MKKTVLVLIMLCNFFSVYGQNITRRQADLLLNSLRGNLADKDRITNLLKLAEFNILKQGEHKTDLDSAVSFIDQAKRINNKIKSPDASGYTTLVESYLARDRRQEEAAKTLADKAIQLLTKTSDYYQLGQAYYYLATFFSTGSSTADDIKAIQLYEQGIQAFKKAKAIERQADGYKMLGEYAEDPKTAFEKYDTALSLYNSIHYKAVQGVYDGIAVAHIFNLDLQKSLAYGLLALKTAHSVKDTTMQLCEINNHLGIIFYRKKDYKSAAIYLMDALKTAKAYNDTLTIYLLGDNIVNSYINDKNPTAAKNVLQQIIKQYPISNNHEDYIRTTTSSFIKIYTLLHQIKEGKPYVERLKALDIIFRDKIGNTKFAENTMFISRLIDDNFVIAKFYLAAKEYDAVTIHLNKNVEMVNKAGTAYDKAVMNELRFKVDTAQKNYSAAVDHLLKLHKIKDSIFNETKAIEFQKQQVQYQTQYETEKKNHQIQTLKQRDLLQQSNLDRAYLIKDITIGGILAMIVISALFYRNYRQKQAANNIITRKNELLQHLLTEKEWLLKEVHHRVKNNLHTVICLLESQARYLENDALQAIETSQHRIYAMSLIHQKLYQSDDIKTINMATYIPELVQSLIDGVGTAGQIYFKLDVEAIDLSLSRAIPLALIINEAVTNSIKYAFPIDRKGEISISMTSNGEKIMLCLADNGIGMPQIDHDAEPASLGLRLIRGLSEDIEAETRFEVHNGTKIVIIFKPDPLSDPENLLTSSQIAAVTYA